jgi:hypothetical protein
MNAACPSSHWSGECRTSARAPNFLASVSFVALVLGASCPTPAFAQDTKEVHGSGDTYGAQGVALAWGVLRGADEASTQVVLRVDANPRVYGTIAVVGKNPFGGQERVLQPPTTINASIDVRVPRAQYADFPRTELRLYSATAATAPSLVVYYLGVPDTTPEFTDAAKLDTYLADRIARARAGPRTP